MDVSAVTEATDRESYPLYLAQRGREAHAAWLV